MLFEFSTIYAICHTQCAEKSASFKPELQVQFINIASSKTRQLKERLLYTDIFRAPPRAVRVVLQQKNVSHYYSQRTFLQKVCLK